MAKTKRVKIIKPVVTVAQMDLMAELDILSRMSPAGLRELADWKSLDHAGRISYQPVDDDFALWQAIFDTIVES